MSMDPFSEIPPPTRQISDPTWSYPPITGKILTGQLKTTSKIELSKYSIGNYEGELTRTSLENHKQINFPADGNKFLEFSIRHDRRNLQNFWPNPTRPDPRVDRTHGHPYGLFTALMRTRQNCLVLSCRQLCSHRRQDSFVSSPPSFQFATNSLFTPPTLTKQHMFDIVIFCKSRCEYMELIPWLCGFCIICCLLQT